MLFSAKAEYAVIAMLELATRFQDPQPVRLKTIVDTHQIPDRFLVQILLQLKGAGLILSTRGAAGGYQLSRAPDTISLADIINVIDRNDEANPGRGMDESNLVRATREVWADILQARQRILEQTTLAELINRAAMGTSFSYQI